MLSMSAEAPRLECAPSMRAMKTTPTASLSSECKVEVSRVDRAHRRDGEASVRWERKPPLGVRDARNNEYHGCARRRVGEAAGTGGSRSRAARELQQRGEPARSGTLLGRPHGVPNQFSERSQTD